MEWLRLGGGSGWRLRSGSLALVILSHPHTPVAVNRVMESDLRRWMRLVEGDAWHGSPRQFAAFSTDHMGSGEGFSSFGWGLYFTDTRAVADWYRHINVLP